LESQAVALTPVADRAKRRIIRRIMPYLFVLYIIAFLDRVNVSYAKLEMLHDLNFSEAVYGFGAGIFFFGYFLFEIPGSIIVEKWSARKWIARIMISWGILAVLMGFIHTETQFYGVRFLLGAAEAGFFPGIIVYLSHWFRYEDRAKAVAMFMTAIPFSNILGSPISGLLLDIKWFNLQGWRWLFILEGFPAIIFGFVTLYYLTDRPQQAKWLKDDEREWITGELEKEHQQKAASHSLSILKAFQNRDVLLLTAAYFFIVTSNYGLNFFLPTFVKKLSGSSNLMITLITAIPYCFYLIAMLFLGWSSDRTGERRWHTVIPMVAVGLGLLLSIPAQDNAVLAVAMFSLASAGLGGYLPSFWALPTRFLTGAAAAATIGLVNSVGNLGGFVGPYVVGYLNTRTNSFVGGVLYLAISAFVAACCIVALRQRHKAVDTIEPLPTSKA
jgi:ACS family tartrate transporter-like MFS transporter